MGRELVVDKWVAEADQAPPVARLTGATISIDVGLEGRWSSSANLETIKACRQHSSLLLGISTAFDPVATTGPERCPQVRRRRPHLPRLGISQLTPLGRRRD